MKKTKTVVETVEQSEGQNLLDEGFAQIQEEMENGPDDGTNKCDSCSLEFATCESKSVQFGIDRYPEATGKEADRIISCGSYVTSEEAPDSFVCDETGPMFTRVLPVALTAEEQAVTGAEMARLIGIWTKAKLDKQAFDKSMKNLIDSTEEDYIAIAVKATDGTEDRPTDCYWQMDRQHGRKRLYRCDTGAMVEECNMELLDYDNNETIGLEESIANVQEMAEGQATDSENDDTDANGKEFDAHLTDDPESVA